MFTSNLNPQRSAPLSDEILALYLLRGLGQITGSLGASVSSSLKQA